MAGKARGGENGRVRLDLPKGWKMDAPRAGLAPRHAVESKGGPGGGPALRLSGNGDPLAFGWMARKGIKLAPGRWYRATAMVRHTPEIDPSLSLLINLLWGELNTYGPTREEFFSRFTPAGDGWLRAEHLFKTPDDDRALTWQVFFRAAAQGSIWFAEPEIEPAEGPTPRPATLATTWFEYQPSRERNLASAETRLAEAGRANADFVALPEMVQMIDVPAPTPRRAMEQDIEPLEGPTYRMCAAAARRHRMWVLGWIHEQDGPHVFNTAILFNRAGKYVGRYRKVHLWWPELWQGVSPGDELPVFETDFGRLGVTICYDNWFPLMSYALAMKGAEILCHTSGGYWPELFRARCMDTNCFGLCATSSKVLPSVIVNSDGTQLATLMRPGIATARIDLNQRPSHPWCHYIANSTDGLPGVLRQLHHGVSFRMVDEIHRLTHARPGE